MLVVGGEMHDVSWWDMDAVQLDGELWGRRSLDMLVITRREGEEVVIGDPRNPQGVVRIAGIKGDRVRIAFDFPREIAVHRREVAEQIKAEGESGVAGKIGRSTGS